MNQNCSRQCPLPSAKDLKKIGQRSSKKNLDKDNSLVAKSWFDNKQVLLISNFIGKEPLEQCAARFDHILKRKKNISRPESVELCNEYMRDMDKSDMMLAIYRSK